MNQVNQTLYIPLYGKAFVSRKGIILSDPKAEEIWAAEGFPLKGKSKSKWLAYFMAMRSAVFDGWLRKKLEEHPHGIVLHIGCGMDSRVLRVAHEGHVWFDIDFPEVIVRRKDYYSDTEHNPMIGSDIRDPRWLEQLPEAQTALIVMEGVSMYLEPEAMKAVLQNLHSRFPRVYLLMDCYTEIAAKASKYKNPINDVGVTRVYGLDDPRKLEEGTGLRFLSEPEMTPKSMIDQLQGLERSIFQNLYAGSIAKKMYRMYEFHSQ